MDKSYLCFWVSSCYLRVCKLLQHKEHIYEGKFNFPACFLNMTCFLSVYDEH